MIDHRDTANVERRCWENFIEDHPNIRVHMEVCPDCNGKGAYVNPNIDRHGLTADDECWHDPDFEENYMTGYYNVPCERCNGANVIPVPSDSEVAKEWEMAQRSMYEGLSEQYAEQRMMGYY